MGEVEALLPRGWVRLTAAGGRVLAVRAGALRAVSADDNGVGSRVFDGPGADDCCYVREDPATLLAAIAAAEGGERAPLPSGDGAWVHDDECGGHVLKAGAARAEVWRNAQEDFWRWEAVEDSGDEDSIRLASTARSEAEARLIAVAVLRAFGDADARA